MVMAALVCIMMYELCVVAFKNMQLMRRSEIFVRITPMNIISNWRQACDALSISRPTLYSLTNQSKLRRVRISPGRVGWPQSEINKYIDGLIAEEKGANNE